MAAESNVIPLRRGKPLWTCAGGRLREAERVVRAAPGISNGAKLMFAAIAQGINLQTGVYFCTDAIMAVDLDDVSSKTLGRYRAELAANDLIEVTPGKSGRATVYRVSMTDEMISSGSARIEQRKAEIRASAGKRESWPALDSSVSDIGQNCPPILPLRTPYPYSEREVLCEKRAEGFSREARNGSDSASRQAVVPEDQREIALAEIRSDDSAAEILGDGSAALMIKRLDALPTSIIASLRDALAASSSAEGRREWLDTARRIIHDNEQKVAA